MRAGSLLHCDCFCVPGRAQLRPKLPVCCSGTAQAPSRALSSRIPSVAPTMAVETTPVRELIKSPQDQKEYCRLKLDNGLQVLLIRDPEMKLDVPEAHKVA